MVFQARILKWAAISSSQDLNPHLLHWQEDSLQLDFLPGQCCPIELSRMMGIFCICSVQFGGHQLHVAFEHLKCG